MKKYKRLLDSLFEAESHAPITNSSPEHAVILLSAIFHYSHDRVKVFCGTLRKDVFGDENLISEIRCAAFRGVKIDFILSGEPETDEILELANNFPDLIRIFHLHEQTSVSHFAVGDAKSFRIELNHSRTNALGCANEPEIGFNLEKVFAKMLKRCAA